MEWWVLAETHHSPQAGVRGSCKELFHWYFLLMLRSRIFLSLDDYFPGTSLASVHIVIPDYGGMDLYSPISHVAPILFIFADFVAQFAGPSIAWSHPAIFIVSVLPFKKLKIPLSIVAVKVAGTLTVPVNVSVSGGVVSVVWFSWYSVSVIPGHSPKHSTCS